MEENIYIVYTLEEFKDLDNKYGKAILKENIEIPDDFLGIRFDGILEGDENFDVNICNPYNKTIFKGENYFLKNLKISYY